MLSQQRAPCSLGTFLAGRLVEVGADHIFGVPGDFNLSLLDQLVAHPGLKTVWTCNELNAGYAADGFARRRGVGACVFTYCVGGLSAINACAGAYSEDLAVIFISGGPNSNDYAANHVLHHTIGKPADLGQQARAFQEFTCAAVVVQHLEEAHHQIDHAISEALKHSKPAYIEISCNLAGLSHPSFFDPPIPISLAAQHTNKASLAEAVAAAAAELRGAVKPVLLGGAKLRGRQRGQAFLTLAEALGCAVAVTPDAKGVLPEDHPQYIGHYWGSISANGVNEVVEGADVVLAVGCVWTDYSTVGYSLMLPPAKRIDVVDRRVTLKGGATYGCIEPADFMLELAQAGLPPNPATLERWGRMVGGLTLARALSLGASEPLTTNAMIRRIQEQLSPHSCVLAETGDSWFNSLKLKLPPGARHEIQMRYGSIGWSVGASLGYSLALQAEPQPGRLISLIGDGSFQVTAQAVSDMLRFGATPVILLVNNKGYTIEIEIHDGPYNQLQHWDYVGLVKALHNGQGKLFTARAATEPELVAALAAALADKADHLCFIELLIDTHDCSKELLEFGVRVAAANGRPPNPQ